MMRVSSGDVVRVRQNTFTFSCPKGVPLIAVGDIFWEGYRSIQLIKQSDLDKPDPAIYGCAEAHLEPWSEK